MRNTSQKRICCAVLSVLMLLSGCGRRQTSGGGRASQKSSGNAPVVRAAESLEVRKDGVIQSHLDNNRNLNTQRVERQADTFHLYIENTETMEGFVSPKVTTSFQESIQRLMDVSYNGFTKMDARMLVYADDIGELEWEKTELNKKFVRKMLDKSFYSGNTLPDVSPLAALTWESPSPFEANALTVIVSDFVEPGNDLSALALEIEAYFDKYENSAACVMGITSSFEGTFHVPVDGRKETTLQIKDFSGEAPFYMVMVGPESVVRDTARNLADRLRAKAIVPSYSIYTNNVYAQILAEPLHFDVIGDLKKKKAAPSIIRSYNTGELYEDDAGSAYYAASSGRVETLDSEANGGISTSTQISLMSKDYDGVSQYNWEYSLYSYDTAAKKWVEAGKNALSRSSVTVTTENGPLEDDYSDEPILAPGRKEMRISARLDFDTASSLYREEIYRVEVRLNLNRKNPNAESSASGTNLKEYSIVRADYDIAVNKLSDGWGKTKIWTASPQLHESLQKVLVRTPNLVDLLTSLEQLEEKYQDESEMIEYVDLVFNVPREEPEK